MSATLRILLPDATTNYIKNPAFRYDESDWTAVGSTRTRVLDYARFNIASLRVATAGGVLNEGVYYRVSALSGISENITVSAYVRGTGRVRIRLHDTFGAEWFSDPVDLRIDRWQRIWVSGRSSGSNDVRLYVELAEKAARVRTFYVDGAQMERHPYVTSYCDGDQPGCRWNIMDHNSVSTRSAYTRAGGRWVELAGPERELEDLYMTATGGLGMAPQRLNTQDYALSPGAYLQNSKVLSRVITLTFYAKHRSDSRVQKVSLSYLHSLRQMLIDAIKADKTAGDEPFLLEYQDGEFPLYLQVAYDGGLEGEWDIRNQWVNSFPIRLLAVSPFFEEDDQQTSELKFSENLMPPCSCSWVLGRINGEWSALGGGPYGGSYGLLSGKRGEIYDIGSFTIIRHCTTGGSYTQTSAMCIAYYTGGDWFPLSSVGPNGAPLGATIGPNGYFYIGGGFTQIGGVAINYLAYFNGSAWNPIGAAPNGWIYALAFAPNGDLYVCGGFTQIGGISANYVARWDGVSWHPVGNFNGLNNLTQYMAISPDGSQIYFGGIFTDENTNPGSGLRYIAQYNPSTNLFSDLAGGLNNVPYSLKVSRSNTLYAVGSFTATYIGAVSLLRAAYWNGAGWYQLGDGLDSVAYDIALGDDGTAIIVGSFGGTTSFRSKSLALWTGSELTFLDIDGTSTANDCIYMPNGDIYITSNLPIGNCGFNPKDTVHVSAINYINNIGSANANPKIYIRGSGDLRWLENQTTQTRIYFNVILLPGEDVFIDLARGTMESNLRGNIDWAIVGGSQVKNWVLAPGMNKIAAFMAKDVNGLMRISYTPTHWSADATGREDEL